MARPRAVFAEVGDEGGGEKKVRTGGVSESAADCGGPKAAVCRQCGSLLKGRLYFPKNPCFFTPSSAAAAAFGIPSYPI